VQDDRSFLKDLRYEISLLRQDPSLFPSFLLFTLIRLPESLIGLTKDAKKTFFDTGDFPWVKAIEDDWPTIRQELDARLRTLEAIPNFQDIQFEQKALTGDNRWKTYVFYAYGKRVERNCNECPETARLIASIPRMTTALFSILDGPKVLPPHRGPYKGVLRYHLALKVPEPSEQCGIRVKNDIRHWEEGKSLIFDDTHEHEAWNRTDHTRVVLFVDFLRPLPPLLSWLNEAIVRFIGNSGFISNLFENLDTWHEKLDELRSTGGHGQSA
jgi:beta-hydroxylase